ncbi:hypothetical protein GCM10010924_44810 [Rhizobium wenxiniae]|nr:hypothetical protein GCM10010924_44810 [Rhizobium wenxiniae]
MLVSARTSKRVARSLKKRAGFGIREKGALEMPPIIEGSGCRDDTDILPRRADRPQLPVAHCFDGKEPHKQMRH